MRGYISVRWLSHLFVLSASLLIFIFIIWKNYTIICIVIIVIIYMIMNDIIIITIIIAKIPTILSVVIMTVIIAIILIIPSGPKYGSWEPHEGESIIAITQGFWSPSDINYPH